MDTGLPPGWEIRHSNSKKLPYYFQASTQQSRWESPEGTDSEKLKQYMANHHHPGAKPTHASKTDQNLDSKIRCAHLLIKHKDSRRPSSWRQAEITRSKNEARAILEAHLDRIKSGVISLGEIATTESDDSSARKRGDLGFFARGQMQREFEETAFALKPGEVSGVVETASGLHVIERLE